MKGFEPLREVEADPDRGARALLLVSIAVIVGSLAVGLFVWSSWQQILSGANSAPM